MVQGSIPMYDLAIVHLYVWLQNLATVLCGSFPCGEDTKSSDSSQNQISSSVSGHLESINISSKVKPLNDYRPS